MFPWFMPVAQADYQMISTDQDVSFIGFKFHPTEVVSGWSCDINKPVHFSRSFEGFQNFDSVSHWAKRVSSISYLWLVLQQNLAFDTC